MQLDCLDPLPLLEARIHQLSSEEIAELLEPLRLHLLQPLPPGESGTLGPSTINACRLLYSHGRSRDALPLARTLLAQAEAWQDPALTRRAATACGLLLGDTADVVGAIEHHVRALRLALAEADRVETSRVWNNLGLAFAIANNYELAMRCNLRAVEVVRDIKGPVYSRYTALANAANAQFQLGGFEEGLRFARLALEEMTPAFEKEDPYGGIILRRNLVYLLIATGHQAESKQHAAEVARLAQASGTPRAWLAAATTRAAQEISAGQFDIALTRLDSALARAREVPGLLRDTLAGVIRAEEAAGRPDRALMRLKELAEHTYHHAIDRARKVVELAGIDAERASTNHRDFQQANARLVSQLERREVPAQWDALRRVAIGAVLRVDHTGWHGVRTGALTKALALEHGVPPIEALEIGLAAELHDIGLGSVPEAILTKPGPLNAVERSLYDRHTDAGNEILGDDLEPRILMAREIARYHHARWDGRGHPERVGGHYIPMPARMCAIADAYDDMACGNGGREALSMNEALAALHRAAGTEFDPGLVGSFETMITRQASERNIDPSEGPCFENFQQLITSLEEDRGFL